MRRLFSFIFCLALVLSAQSLASYFTFTGLESWYATLEKPFWSPPNWIFGPVWTLLYFMIACSLYLLMDAPFEFRKKINAYVLWGVQLILNVVWCALFFYFRWIGGAFMEILLLILAIALYIYQTYRLSKTASLLMVPYLIWVVYAASLNLGFYYQNS